MDLLERLRRLGQQHGRALLMLFVAALAVHDIFGAHGFLAMQRTKSEIARVRADLNRLDQENLRLEEEVAALKSDPHKIESIARDELGLAKQGEVIIKIPQSHQPPPDSPKP